MKNRLLLLALPLSYLAVTLTSLYFVSQETEAREESDRVGACMQRNDTHRAIKGLIEVAVSDEGGPTPLTAIPSFNNLDPETQKYLADLQEALAEASRSGNGVRQALLEYADKLELEDCTPP